MCQTPVVLPGTYNCRCGLRGSNDLTDLNVNTDWCTPPRDGVRLTSGEGRPGEGQASPCGRALAQLASPL